MLIEIRTEYENLERKTVIMEQQNLTRQDVHDELLELIPPERLSSQQQSIREAFLREPLRRVGASLTNKVYKNKSADNSERNFDLTALRVEQRVHIFDANWIQRLERQTGNWSSKQSRMMATHGRMLSF